MWASDELTGNETARILGEAIGKPNLTWNIIPSEQMRSGLEAVGMKPDIAAGLVEMYASQHSGSLGEDYYRHQPAVMGKVKMTDFCQGLCGCLQTRIEILCYCKHTISIRVKHL